MAETTLSGSQSWAGESDSWADSIGGNTGQEAPETRNGPSWNGGDAAGATGATGATGAAGASPEGSGDAASGYSLDLPEGVEADSELLEEFSALARESGLPPATARKILDLEVKNAQRQIEAFTGQQQDWREEITNDPQFGGARLEATVGQARKALEAFDPEGTLLPELNRTGYGNHPGIIRFLARVGGTLQEDRVFHARGHDPADKRPLRERLWPD